MSLAVTTYVRIALATGVKADAIRTPTLPMLALTTRKGVVAASMIAAADFLAEDTVLDAGTIRFRARLPGVKAWLEQLRIVSVLRDDAFNSLEHHLDGLRFRAFTTSNNAR